MATNVPALTPTDPNVPRLFFTEPPVQPAFMSTTTQAGSQIFAQNHDRTSDPNLPPAPPPLSGSAAVGATMSHLDAAPPPAPIPPPVTDQPASGHGRASDEGDGTSTGTAESESEDEQPPTDQWQPMIEDRSVPCEDEMLYIHQRGEHSALDHAYWEKKIFLDLDDPELKPLESGRIEWTVEHFNGTKESPNRETVMRSATVSVGGYDWCIKMFPRGNNSEYVSVYLECVTMQADAFNEFEDLSTLPLPFLDNHEKAKQRASVAIQLGIVMYNPNEPRVYEYQTDAHQFTKASADYGWTRFTRYSRNEFPYRMHGQRQAILRDDKIAFLAHIRVIQDPTRCMWSHGSDAFHDSLRQTGLRPFSTLTPMYAAKLPLLHFTPFRELIRNATSGKVVYWLQCLLWKMMSRTRSSRYGNPIHAFQCDGIVWLQYIARSLREETDAVNIVTELLGTLDPSQGAAVGSNRLRTKAHNSVQGAVDMHASPIETPAMLTLELERAEFDRKERTWNKITNKVDIQNRIVVSGKPYILYAFSTHCGDLTSNRFNVYIRPNGPEGLWYAYTNGSVTAMTHKQAVSGHCGFDASASPVKEARHSSSRHRRTFRVEDLNEVAHIVYYIRDDYKTHLRDFKASESWDVTSSVKHYKPPKEVTDLDIAPQTAVGPGYMDREWEGVLNSQIERARQNSMDEECGAATPSWIMDGEDIVMNDAAIEAEAPENAVLDKVPTELLTIDCLGREYYQGSVIGGKYHGEGHIIYMNGDEYIGAFLGGEKHGYGKMIYARTGNVYEGKWQRDQHHGEGKLIEAKTKNIFEGNWNQGKKHGKFILQGEVTEEDKGCCSICYDKEINTAFYDCGHVLACRECAYKIDTCPVCRRRVVGRLELFGVKMLFE